MALLKEINNKTATVTWSPLASNPNLIAVGTKDSGSLGFDDHGGELELHSLDFGSPRNLSTDCIASTKTISRFASLAWSRMASFTDAFPSGLIAGGMIDGTVQVWDAQKLINGEESLVSTIEKHTSVVNGVQFNPHTESSHLLATGGSDSAIYVMSLDHPDSPTVFSPSTNPNSLRHTAEVSKVAWNTQVSHILASASSNGSTIIWDLRQKKHWCELRDTQRESISDIAWNPSEGLHLITASCDDHNPVIKLWDLRSSTTLPLATLSHSQGILSVSWCPKDPGLLISCGKDNKTILWDLYSLKPIYELKSVDNTFQSQSQIFGGLAQTVGRRYFVDWSPQIPGVIASCSFERKVQIHSLIGGSSRSNRAPKWFQKPCGASFGFGGKLVTFGNTNQPEQVIGHKKHFPVQIKTVTEHPELIQASEKFENAISSRDFKSFCTTKAQNAKTLQDQQEWGFMRIIFEKNAREQLLQYIGFDSNQIAQECTNFVQSKLGNHLATPLTSFQSSPQPVKNIEDFFGNTTDPIDEDRLNQGTETELDAKNENKLTVSEEKKEFLEEWKPMQRVTSECEEMIKKALLVGNFEAAVDCCLSVGLYADALILASFGGTELWMKTQNSYFERQLPKRQLLKTIHGIINSELQKLVSDSALLKWRETLAILSTYASSHEFSPLCELLGERLELEIGDKNSAVLCYLIALNIQKTVRFWISTLQAANDKLGQINIEELQEFVEKVTIFGQAEPDMDLGEEVIKFFRQYAELLASQGQTKTAIKYLKSNDPECAVLIDRLTKFPVLLSVSEPFVFDDKPQIAQMGQSFSDVHQAHGYHQQTHQQVQFQGHPTQTNPQQIQTALPQQVLAPLPIGWVEMFDPNSNLPYYACPASGMTQWERPVDPMYQQQQYNEQQYNQQIVQDMSFSSRVEPTAFNFGSMATTQPVVTSLSTTTPTTPITTTTISSTTDSLNLQKKTLETSYDHRQNVPENNLADQLQQMSLNNIGQDNMHIVRAINELLFNLNNSALTPSESKQLSDAQKSLTALFEKLNDRSMTPDVLSQVSNMAMSIEQKNFAIASSIQAELAKTVWNEHKVWLKGIKYLIQLGMKKS